MGSEANETSGGTEAEEGAADCWMAVCRCSRHSPCRPRDTSSAQQPNERNNRSDSRNDKRARRGPEEKETGETEEVEAEDDGTERSEESTTPMRRTSPAANVLASIALARCHSTHTLHTIEQHNQLLQPHSATRHNTYCGLSQRTRYVRTVVTQLVSQ